MFGMFEKKGIGFKQIQTKKRFDRTVQLAIIGSFLTGIGVAVKNVVRLLAQAMGVRQRSIYMVMVAAGIFTSQIKKAMTKKEATA